MRTPKGPEAVPEFRRLVVGEDADVRWHVSRGKDAARIDLHDRQAPARRSLIGSVTIPYDEVGEMRAALGEMVLTATDDWAVRGFGSCGDDSADAGVGGAEEGEHPEGCRGRVDGAPH